MCLLMCAFVQILKWLRQLVYSAIIGLRYPVQLLSCLYPRKASGFLSGFLLGVLYYNFLLTKIPFPRYVHVTVLLVISLLLGILNSICRQLRCITLLTIPMYCGKPGRGVLKALVLTYVIAGPIKNMCLNAREVVRVFACSTQLSYNLSRTKYDALGQPFKRVMSELRGDMNEVVDTFRSFTDVALPIAAEFEDNRELVLSRDFNDGVDFILGGINRSGKIEAKYRIRPNEDQKVAYQKQYLKKLEYRCEAQLSRGVSTCVRAFSDGLSACEQTIPRFAAWLLCWPLRVTRVCGLLDRVSRDICDSREHVDPGLGEGYLSLQMAWREMAKDVTLEARPNRTQLLEDIQDAKETAERVMHAFEEKDLVMNTVIQVVNVFVALLFLRVIVAAGTYHDCYLTSIEFDNFYITSYFKKLDKRRQDRHEVSLLPLKKMEKMKYVDVHSSEYNVNWDKLLVQTLKVLLEMVTATTFVMLDRLFYEALDVVRRHAELDVADDGSHNLKIEIKGSGLLTKIVYKIVSGLESRGRSHRAVSNRLCLPTPHLMPSAYFLKIYGGYLWIQLLLYMNPYTARLSRLICSFFYPRREKQRILHLYNDILKKRMKLQKTLRRKAVQVVRAYYLSGENMLSLRMKFPQLLGWLKMFPPARMSCLICGDTEPLNPPRKGNRMWQSCTSARCPFIYCPECWQDVGRRCLACDPGLAELSDVDSLSEDDRPHY